MAMELDGTRRVTPLVRSRFIERNGIISPDGRWLAYEANDSGRFRFTCGCIPDVNSGLSVVSTPAARSRSGRASGQELIYASPTGALMRVGVTRGPSWSATDAVGRGERGVLHESGLVGPIGRSVTRWPAVPHYQGGWPRRDRPAYEPRRRAALGRGVEAPRASALTAQNLAYRPCRRFRFSR